jgi:hypothetical protein
LVDALIRSLARLVPTLSPQRKLGSMLIFPVKTKKQNGFQRALE